MFVSNPKYLAKLYLKSTDFLFFFFFFKSTYFQINVYPKLEIWDNSKNYRAARSLKIPKIKSLVLQMRKWRPAKI